jgi:hypothetical protein
MHQANAVRRSVVLAGVAIVLWGVAHSAAMSAGAGTMHDQLPSSTGAVLGCMLVVGLAAAAATRVTRRLSARVMTSAVERGPSRTQWPSLPAGTPARASPTWLQRFQR